MNTSKLREKDLKYLWHPYTQHKIFINEDFPIIERASGIYLYDTDNNKYIDTISSWWCVNLGHSREELVKTISDQSGRLQHSILGGMSHVKAIELAENLSSIAPGELNRCYFASDGASAVEASLRIALQYHRNRGNNNKTKLASLKGGYHGDTLGAVAVGYVPAFHKFLSDILAPSIQYDAPNCFNCPYNLAKEDCQAQCLKKLEIQLEHDSDNIAAFILEPLCQGASGMNIYPPVYLKKLRDLLERMGIIMIADEIATGIGRTGAYFACDHAAVVPDIIITAKALTNGYLPLSAVVIKEEIFNNFISDENIDKTFYHGHTFCGNPIAAALAVETLRIYKEENIIENSQKIISLLDKNINELGKKYELINVRSLGMLAAFDLPDEFISPADLKKVALQKGLIIRPLGNVVYICPPLITTEKEIVNIFSILDDILNSCL